MAINNFNVGVGTTSQLTRYRYVATGGETSVSGSDADGKTLSYTVGLEQVFLNGVNLVRGQDYTATNGTSVGSLTALVASDVVEVFAYVPFNIANALTVSTVDAKGDLLVGTGADAVGRLAVGTNGQLLSAASGETSGLKWANPGLTLISTTSFSAVSAASLPDNTFSSTYQNYKIHFQLTANSADQTMNMRFRNGGTDRTPGEYNFSSKGADINAGAFEYFNNAATAFNIGQTDGGNSGTGYFMQWDIINPFDTKKTFIQGFSTGVANSGTIFHLQGGGIFYNDLSNDSLTIYPSTGTISGSFVVYGYNK